MRRLLPLLSGCLIFAQTASAQTGNRSKDFPDSVVVAVHPSYNNVSGTHRWLFGKNYREEWAQKVKLPVIRLSKVYGGLTPIKQGGGMQSKSLRLAGKNGVEYVLRSVEKTPDKLLPEGLRGTFAVDWIGDALSGQHPYSALVVPPLAAAANVPHANPVIGVVADDAALGEFSKIFKGTVCLLEEREPDGDSDNTPKMQRELIEDADNRFDKDEFLRARMLDLLIGDWDRHEDQWRWAVKKGDKGKFYTAVPRDRDQVFHVVDGVFPHVASLSWLDPIIDNFTGDIPHVKYSLYKTKFIRPYFDAQFTYDEWMKVVNSFVSAETDQVLEASLQRLPKENLKLRHDVLYKKLKERRDNISKAMSEYYKFMFKIVDIRTTDKNEMITLTDAPDGGMHIVIQKINKAGEVKDVVFDMVYDSKITQEIRLYTEKGDDHIVLNYTASPIKLRIIGDNGQKTYDVQQTAGRVKIYNRKDSVTINGAKGMLSKHFSNDTLNTRYAPTNLYSVWMPQATASINPDDGFLLGLGFKYTHQDGFRTTPYNSMQQLMVTKSFASDAFRIKYNAEWINVIGKADIILQADIKAPNKMNVFGRGNETELIKFDDYKRFHRTRFNTFQLDPALRWNTGESSTLSFGPSFMYYHMNLADNGGRFINNTSQLHSYDSTTLEKDKAHLGFLFNYTTNKRNNNMLPSSGYYFNVIIQGYEGLNSYSKAFMVIKPEFTVYQKLNSRGTIVLSDRVGGGVTIGQTAFYQSLFLGGQGNLLGYLQNRFAGQDMLFNNLQARIKLANIASYILPGQLGVTGFDDTGRVWVKNDNSDKWHNGFGGGLYFSPAGLTIFQILAAHSSEGWYPYISFNFRI